MKKSVITEDMEHCIICGRPYPQIHHVFYGTGNRKLSDKLGFVVPLCQEHHTGPNGVHFNKKLDIALKRKSQKIYESKVDTRNAFISTFGRSYL